MANWEHHKFEVRQIGETRSWRTESSRYPEYSRMLLAELIELAAQIQAEWPPGVKSLKAGDVGHSELWGKVRRRDMLSDSVRIFTALSVESFLNFYGVARLGQAQFDSWLEKLGPATKLGALLRICDGITVDRDMPISKNVYKIAMRRNALVHPSTTEVLGDLAQANKDADAIPIPGAAIEAVEDMASFYRQFVELVPDAQIFLPDEER